MSSPFVAEIRMFGFNFAPTGWSQCNGQLLPISQNTALFSLLGTFYGGDGKSTFALPNLQGSAAVHQGQLKGGSEYFLGQQAGEEFVTLLTSEIPAHNHSFSVTTGAGTTNSSSGNQLGKGSSGNPVSGITQAKMYSTAAPQTQMNFQGMALYGGSQPHNNMMPYLTVEFCIALQGVFPPRT
jgi:microcystin-dependent protein